MVIVTERGHKSVTSICSESLSESIAKATDRERSLLEFTSQVKSPSGLHPAVLEFMEAGWGPPVKDSDGNLGYIRAAPGRNSNSRTLIWHTEYVHPVYNAHPQACSRSARREFEVKCRDRTAALKLFQEFEGRAAGGRVLKDYPMKEPKYLPAQPDTITGQLVKTACD